MSHYTKTKEEKTAELMERVLDILVHASEPIELNGKEYKKINFSQGQVTDAIQGHALPEEHIQGIVFKDPSTISHNDTYKSMIRDAKEKRAKRLSADSDLSFDGREPTVTELKIEIDRLMYDNAKLTKTVNGLESIVRQAGIEKTLEDDKELVIEPVNVDKKLISVLEKLLLLNSKNEMFHIEKGKGQVPAQVFYQAIQGTTLLCDLNDLKALNISFDANEYGKIVIVEKGLLDA